MTEHSPLFASTDAGGDAFEVLNPDAPSAVIFVCDHASNHVPPGVNGGDLGLTEPDMARHIAYDIGARGLTLLLARHFASAAVLSRFSRLVIDPNRGEDDPTLVMRLNDGSIVPGNRGVDAAGIERRLTRYHRPYHDAISAMLDRIVARGQVPRIVSVHSFTPQYRGRKPRPWHVAVLWDRDASLAGPLLAALREDASLCVGDNEPYTGQLRGDCMYRHGTKRGLPHALLEVRNDLISDAASEAEWAARLAPALERALTAID